MNTVVKLKEPSNGARDVIEASMPYTVVVTIEGAADFLFHRWNCEAVDEVYFSRVVDALSFVLGDDAQPWPAKRWLDQDGSFEFPREMQK